MLCNESMKYLKTLPGIGYFMFLKEINGEGGIKISIKEISFLNKHKIYKSCFHLEIFLYFHSCCLGH